MVAVALALASGAHRATAQAPLAGGLGGRTLEAQVLYQTVSNGYGDWRGAYLRGIMPSERNTLYIDALALDAFHERGVQTGVTWRHDWTSRFFDVLGGSVGSGAPILSRARVDASIGTLLGPARQVQVTVGASYVKSVNALSDVAGTASIAWYLPKGLLVEVGGRYNVSRPGDVASHRLSAVSIWTPSPRRSFSLRAIGGSEGYQVLGAQTTLTRFNSKELSLAWREKVGGPWALSVQGDHYTNPYYTRAGVTLGVARNW
jgi:YaiO family outer membrane protein